MRTFADAQSGIASNVLTRTRAPVAANVCGTYDPATTVTLASPAVVPPIITETGMAPGCYRYTQTGTNAVGGFGVGVHLRARRHHEAGGRSTHRQWRRRDDGREHVDRDRSGIRRHPDGVDRP